MGFFSKIKIKRLFVPIMLLGIILLYAAAGVVGKNEQYLFHSIRPIVMIAFTHPLRILYDAIASVVFLFFAFLLILKKDKLRLWLKLVMIVLFCFGAVGAGRVLSWWIFNTYRVAIGQHGLMLHYDYDFNNYRKISWSDVRNIARDKHNIIIHLNDGQHVSISSVELTQSPESMCHAIQEQMIR
jgi:hypothetical protein